MLPFRSNPSLSVPDEMKKQLILILAVTVLFFFNTNARAAGVWDDAWARLDKIRNEKKNQLYEYLEATQKNAFSVASDTAMLSFFHLKNKYFRLQKITPPPTQVTDTIRVLKKKIREHYIQHYMAFYDVLFINVDGDIFYTLRQQADYHKNIFKGDLKHTALAGKLMKDPNSGFVDYQFYAVSSEPSAFYIIPVGTADKLEGWIVFQLSINKINSIFTQETGLGLTGEVFLVNKNQYMLTDSRFDGDSSILKRHLSPENIASKFKENKGHRTIIDYRGFRALSSFEVFTIAQNEWLLIAKIDEDEVLTEYYRQNRKTVEDILSGMLGKPSGKPCKMADAEHNTILVDMNEYKKTSHANRLRTLGASTCTVLIVTYPQKFGYMSHISNLDRIYGNHITDLTSHMLKQINTFDIYPFEKRHLSITLVATHLDTFKAAIHLLVENGFLLSQIRCMINTNAQFANPVHDYRNDSTTVEWSMDKDSENFLYTCSDHEENLGQRVHSHISKVNK